MKITLENLTREKNKSYRMMFNPRLSDLFLWHFHPEFELVYITGATATRHVGDHISTYQNSDLVLIGSHIPHLNFDYGVKTDYKKVVCHIKPEFIEHNLKDTPEFAAITHLFQQASYGICFTGTNKDSIGKQLFALQNLPPFEEYLKLLHILQTLATTQEYQLLHTKPYIKRYRAKEQDRLQRIYRYVDHHYQQKITLDDVAKHSNMSKEAFCRYFKKITQYTFTDFLNRYRVSQSKLALMSGKTVSEACYAAGFESLSYYNRVFKKITDENPSAFRKRYR